MQEQNVIGGCLNVDSDPYGIFMFAINAQITKQKYTYRLTKFFDFINLEGETIQQRCRNAVEMDRDGIDNSNNINNNKWLLNNILRFLQAQKERVERKEITGATVHNFVKAIKLFCEMNDISIPWKKITRGLPKGRKYAYDRAPTIEDIKRIIEYPDRRIKAIVCTMSSSGIRLGAWDYLRWKDIHPAKRNGKIIAAKIIVYAEDEDEYFSFITPEAYYELEKWMNYRRESGEAIDGNSWILRNMWNTKQGFKRGFIDSPKKLKSSGVKRLMEDALWIQGLRKKLEEGKRRHEFQADHGFRKWFKTRCEISGMKQEEPLIFRFNGTEYKVFVYYDRYRGLPKSVIKYAGKSDAIDYTEVECALPVSRINCNGNDNDPVPLFDKLYKYYTWYKIPKADIKFSLDMRYDIRHITEEDG